MEFVLLCKKLNGGFVLAKMSGKVKEWSLREKKDASAQDAFVMRTELTPELRKLRVKEPPCRAPHLCRGRVGRSDPEAVSAFPTSRLPFPFRDSRFCRRISAYDVEKMGCVAVMY